MSNDARIPPRASHPYGFRKPFGYTIGIHHEHKTPLAWLRLPPMPALALLEKYFPAVSLAQLQAAVDTAEAQLEAGIHSTFKDMLASALGAGIRLYSHDDDYIAIEGLGDPTQWGPEDHTLLDKALRMAYAALREAVQPKNLAARIERNGVPQLRDVARTVPLHRF